MNDHVIPMFSVTRREVLERMTAKLSSIAETRTKLETALSEARLDLQKTGLAAGMKSLDELSERVAFLRDHLAPEESWSMSAQQAIELLTLTAPVHIDPTELQFAVNRDDVVRNAVHNVNGGRKLRI